MMITSNLNDIPEMIREKEAELSWTKKRKELTTEKKFYEINDNYVPKETKKEEKA